MLCQIFEKELLSNKKVIFSQVQKCEYLERNKILKIFLIQKKQISSFFFNDICTFILVYVL